MSQNLRHTKVRKQGNSALGQPSKVRRKVSSTLLFNIRADESDSTFQPLVFIDTAGMEYYERIDSEAGEGDEGSKSNENEANLVLRWVQKLASALVQPGSTLIDVSPDGNGTEFRPDNDTDTVRVTD
jgi:hypothetical protein